MEVGAGRSAVVQIHPQGVVKPIQERKEPDRQREFNYLIFGELLLNLGSGLCVFPGDIASDSICPENGGPVTIIERR